MAECVCDPVLLEKLLEWLSESWVPIGALLAAGYGALFAWKRYNIADGELRHKQFQEAANALAGGEVETRSSYLRRTASAAALSFLANEAPNEYHVIVMRLFEAYLHYHPSRYFRSIGAEFLGDHGGVVDPDSSDTAEIIRFVEHRDSRQEKAEKRVGYRFGLATPSPFKFDGKKIKLRDEPLRLVRTWCRTHGIESRFLKDRHPDEKSHEG